MAARSKGAKAPKSKQKKAKATSRSRTAKAPAPARTKAPAKAPPATKNRTPPPPKPARAPGERRFWLLKTEPGVFSFDDLLGAPGRTTFWDGVRNYQARNTLRDDMKVGDGVLVYHSNAEPPALAGLAEVVREGSPDPTQFDRASDHFDPAARPDAPIWFGVEVRAVRPLARALPLPSLRGEPGLAKMALLQKGSRLSVQPVTAEEWAIIDRLAGA